MNEAEVLNRVGKNMAHVRGPPRPRRVERRHAADAGGHPEGPRLAHQPGEERRGRRRRPGPAEQQDQQNQDNKQNKAGQKNKGNGQAKVGMGKPKGGLKGGQQQAREAGRSRAARQKPDQQVAKGGEKPENQGGGQQGQKPPEPDQQNGNQGGGGGKSEGPPSKLADMYKDVWGHLPESMRAEMNAYSREQFMAKYDDLIKQYYSTIAEQSRKKD